MPPRAKTLRQRLEARLRKDADGCWRWLGAVNDDGYGEIFVGWRAGCARKDRVHRVAYRLHHGPIPIGLTVDHLCRVRNCANPEHLEAVSLRENIRRARDRRGCCKRGHPYTKENTYLTPAGVRCCNTCRRERVRARSRAQGRLANKFKTHCKRGHEFTEANTYRTTHGGRGCLVCKRSWYARAKKMNSGVNQQS
jgi:hypothetical protein